MNTFLITGFGRSGTTFLSKVLNMSPSYTVMHEHLHTIKFHNDGDPGVMPQGRAYLYQKECPKHVTDAISIEFNKYENYGQVNGFFREIADRIDVDSKAVIVREPKSMILSSYNWVSGNPSEFDNTIEQCTNGLLAVGRLIDLGIRSISFKRIISDLDYIQEIAQFVGIFDLTLTDDIFTPVNQSKNPVASTFDEIDVEFKKRCLPFIDEFTDKYLEHFK